MGDLLPSLDCMSFEVSEPGVSKKMDPMEIQNKTFSSSWRGYKVDEVRSFLAQVAFEVRGLTSEVDNLRAKIVEIENRGQVTEATLAAKVIKAEEMAAQVLQDATEAAKALREQAEQFFDATRARAEAEAQMLIENATVKTRTKQLSDPEVFSGPQFTDPTKRELELAREKSLEIIEQSKIEGRAMIDQARDLRNEILADLRHKRAMLDTEIADLATRRIEAYQSLSRAVQLISEAASIVAVGDIQGDSTPLSSEAVVIEARHIDKSPQDLDLDLNLDESFSAAAEKARSPFVSRERSTMKLGGQHVEMGGHLEEGIVRVFSKEESGASPKSENGPTKDDVSDLSAGLAESTVGNTFDSGSSDYVQSATNDVSNSYVSSTFQKDDENEEEREVSDQSDLDEPKTQEDEGSWVDDDLDIEHQRANFEEFTEESRPIGGPDQSAYMPEVAEEPPAEMPPIEIPTQRPEIMVHHAADLPQEDGGDDKVEPSAKNPRSKRADDILARIRSLRTDEQRPHEQSKSKLSDRDNPEDEPNADPAPQQTPLTSTNTTTPDIESQNKKSSEKEDDDDGQNLYVPPAEVDAATQELLEVREEILAPTATMFFRRAKRILADEQNDLLDKVRRNSGSKVVLEEILEEKVQIDSLAIASLDFFEQIRLRVAELFTKSPGSSLHKEISPHAVEYSEEFAKELLLPLRRRVEEALAVDVTLEDQATVGALGVIYRDVRSNRLEALISQYVNSVFCATVMRESGYDSFVWAIDPEDTPCADCLDNSLAGPTSIGEQFPTGHHHPAIHSGCRCLLVPFIA